MNHHEIPKKSWELMGRWSIHPSQLLDSLQLDRGGIQGCTLSCTQLRISITSDGRLELCHPGSKMRAVADRNQPLQREQKYAKMVTKLSKSLSALQVVMMANQFMLLCCMCLTQKGHADVTGSWIGWVQLFHFPPCTWHHESLSSLTGKSSFYSSNASSVFVTMHFY